MLTVNVHVDVSHDPSNDSIDDCCQSCVGNLMFWSLWCIKGIPLVVQLGLHFLVGFFTVVYSIRGKKN